MKTISRISLCLLIPVSLGFAQSTTTSTTTAVAMSRGDQTISLASSTGVTAAGLAPATGLYVDREYMTVVSNANAAGTGNVWNVKRGVAGIQSPHASGATVWVGPPSVFDLGPNDRVGPCTATSFAYLPMIMVRSGNVTYCVGQWGDFKNNPQVGPVLASQAGQMTGAYQVLAKVTHISGSAAITGFGVPPGLPDGGTFIIIPDGAFTWTAANNIVSTGTAVVGKALIFTYDKTAGKLYPSY